MSESFFLSAAELAEQYGKRALSPVELLDVILARAEIVQQRLNPFRTINAERAREAARASEHRWAAGKPLSPLDGVPVAIKDNQAMAVARNIRVSPRKLNLVAQQIRGKKVDRALNELTFSRKRIAGAVKKALQSAIANAENNHDLDVDELVVSQAHVGKALVLKRFHARGRGRMGKILKPFANLTIVVRQVESEAA